MVHSTNSVNDCYGEKTKTFDFNFYIKKVCGNQTDKQSATIWTTDTNLCVETYNDLVENSRLRESKKNELHFWGTCSRWVYTVHVLKCICVKVQKSLQYASTRTHRHTHARGAYKTMEIKSHRDAFSCV